MQNMFDPLIPSPVKQENGSENSFKEDHNKGNSENVASSL